MRAPRDVTQLSSCYITLTVQDLAFGKEIYALQELENMNSLDKEKLQKWKKASMKNNSPI